MLEKLEDKGTVILKAIKRTAVTLVSCILRLREFDDYSHARRSYGYQNKDAEKEGCVILGHLRREPQVRRCCLNLKPCVRTHRPHRT